MAVTYLDKIQCLTCLLLICMLVFDVGFQNYKPHFTRQFMDDFILLLLTAYVLCSLLMLCHRFLFLIVPQERRGKEENWFQGQDIKPPVQWDILFPTGTSPSCWDKVACCHLGSWLLWWRWFQWRSYCGSLEDWSQYWDTHRLVYASTRGIHFAKGRFE